MPQSWARIDLLQGTVPFTGGSVTGASTAGNGVAADTQGTDAALQLEVHETNGGTASLNIEGSFDGSTWYAVGYQQVDNIATPSRAIAAISILANSAHVYQILDPYPQLRARLSSVVGAAVIVRLYQIAG